MNKVYTPEMIVTIKELYPTTNTYTLAAQLGVSYASLKTVANANNIKKSSDYIRKPFNSIWNEATDQYLRNNYATQSAEQIAQTLGCTRLAVKNRAYILGLRKEFNLGQFRKGKIPPNKGKKQTEFMSPEGIARTIKYRFQKGNEPHNTKYDGHERISVEGYIEVRVRKGKYQLKHRLVWEQANGPIPPQHIVTFVDGNKLNCTLDNLKCISLKENALRNSIHNYPDDLKQVFRLQGKLNKLIKKRLENEK